MPNEMKKTNFIVVSVTVLLISILFAVWMQRFEILSAGTDLMIINRLTGKTTIVNASGIATEVADKGNVKSLKFDKIDLPNLKSSAVFYAKWRDGKLYYKFHVLDFSEIVSKGRSSGNASFTISLLDNDSFEIKSIGTEANRMIKTVDEKGKGQGLSYTSSMPMSYSDFKEVSDWNISWAGFPDK